MYTLSEIQLSSVENFIEKLDDSMVKARMESWLGKIDPNRLLSEQLEEFVGFATHLPSNLQNYPQSFAFSVKNGEEVNDVQAIPKPIVIKKEKQVEKKPVKPIKKK